MSGNPSSRGSQSPGFLSGGSGGGVSETGTSGAPNGSQLRNTFFVGGGIGLVGGPVDTVVKAEYLSPGGGQFASPVYRIGSGFADHAGGGFHAVGNALVGGSNVEYDQVNAFAGGTHPAQLDTRAHLQTKGQAKVVEGSQTHQEATQHRHEAYALPNHTNNVQLRGKHPVVFQLGEHSKVACRPVEGVHKFDVTIGYASLIEALNDLANSNDAGARAAYHQVLEILTNTPNIPKPTTQNAITTMAASINHLKTEYAATQRTRAITALLYRTEIQNTTNAPPSQTAAKKLITDFEEQTILCNITLRRFKELCERLNDVLGYREMYHQNAVRDKDMLEEALVGLGCLGLSDLEGKMGMGGLF